MKITLFVLGLLVLVGCTFVGNSPEERRQREGHSIQYYPTNQPAAK